jgi:hypothetical protein
MKVYSIVNQDKTLYYIGSTHRDLNWRFSVHKASFKQYINKKCGFCSIYNLFNEYGVDNCKVELLENVEEGNNIFEREKYYVKHSTIPVVNINYTQEPKTKEQVAEAYRNSYYDKKVNEYKKKYYEKQKLKRSTMHSDVCPTGQVSDSVDGLS